MAGELASGWALSAVMDKKRKRAGPFGLALFRLGSLGPPLSVLLHYTTLCSCCQQHFGDGRVFVGCCVRAACGRPLEVRPRPRAGGGWAPAGSVALQVTTLRAACGVAVIRAGRQRSRWWPAGPLRFRRGWAFRCLMTTGGCGVSVVAAATGRSP